MALKPRETVGEVLFWSYANLAMAHSAVEKGASAYKPVHYMIRARLYKGLLSGEMSVGSLLDDERVKSLSGRCCSYCGSMESPSLDHIFPRASGGLDTGDNVVFACRRCNSSKGKKDLLVWFGQKEKFPPLSVLRRYLKLSIGMGEMLGVMEYSAAGLAEGRLPFAVAAVPSKFPKPAGLIWAYFPNPTD